MKYSMLLVLFSVACHSPIEPEWIRTRERVCVNNICSDIFIDCWKNTRTGVINCDPDFNPEES